MPSQNAKKNKPKFIKPVYIEDDIEEPVAEPVPEKVIEIVTDCVAFEPSSIVVTKHYKIDFYKNISEKGGAMNCAIKNALKDDVIIHIQKKDKGRLWGSCQPKYLLKLIETN